MMNKNVLYYIKGVVALTILVLLAACSPHVENAVEKDTLPPIYPDYTDVTIPRNIAPLNFMLRGDAQAVSVSINGETVVAADGCKVVFDDGQWHEMMEKNAGNDLMVKVFVENDGQWTAYKTFRWTVAADTIDPDRKSTRLNSSH